MSDGGTSRAGHLLGLLAVLAGFGVALAASATLGAGPERGPDVTGAETQAANEASVARLARRLTPVVARRVERIRGLEFEQVPEPRIVSAEFLNRLGAREFRRGERRAERALAVDETEARIVGLLADDEQLDPIVGSTGDLAAAAWDTRRERLYIVSDAAAPDPALIEFFLSHELTHALEDQRFGLPETQLRSDDAALAEVALIEGTATAAMLEYSLRHIAAFDLLDALGGVDTGTGDVPAFYVEQLEFAYLQGAEFVNSLFERAGDWAAVDRALRARPPASTEHVLHPEAYLAGERPLGVGAPAAGLRERGWVRIDEGDVGELATAQLLATGAPRAVADRAAAGWGGDAYALWGRSDAVPRCEEECRSEHVLVVATRWDSPAEGAEFAATMPAYAIGGLGGRPDGENVWALNGGWLALGADRDVTVLAFAPSRGLARRVADSPP